MYHCNLRITVFGQNSMLESIVRSTAPLERFEHIISTAHDFCPQASGDADLVIVDATALQSPANLRRQCRTGAYLILCTTPGDTASWSKDDFQAADEIWEHPLDESLTAARFQKTLENIKLRKDYRLCQTYLDSVIDGIPDMIWFKDKEGIHVKVNKAFCQTVGKPREDVTGRDHCYIWDVSREDFDRGEFVCRETEELVMRKKCTCQFDEKVKSQHGMRQFKTYKSPLFDEDGSIMGTVGFGHDVTDLKNIGTEMEIFLRSMPYAILVRDENGTIINANPKFEKYFNVGKETVIGLIYEQWAADAFYPNKTVNSEGYIEASVHFSGDEPERILEIHEEPLYDVFQNVAGQFSIFRDVTVERTLEAQILHNSNTDFMTGLYNRRCFYHYIAKNRGELPVSLLYVDLDHFKKINDTYGHRVGDEALIKTAELLSECFPRDFITRFGGDEFLIAILGPCDLDNLKLRSEQLLKRMDEIFSSTEYLRELSASIGIAQTCNPKLNIDTLIQQSDDALYKAKEYGRARCFIYAESCETKTP